MATSCGQALQVQPSLTSGVVNLMINGVIYPTWCEIVGSVAWNLIMKTDGTLSTFNYYSALWSNTQSLNPNNVYTGLDSLEYKSALFSVMPFTNIRAGLKYAGVTNWMILNYPFSSLYNVFADGSYRPITSVGKSDWFNLAGSANAGLQANCNLQGFNVVPPGGDRVRLGIVSNEQGDCSSCDSRIGFGGAGLFLRMF